VGATAKNAEAHESEWNAEREEKYMRKKSDIDHDEIKQHDYTPYVMLALAQLGGNARRDPVVEHVGEILKDRLKPCDWRPMYKGPHGIDVAPVGYTGRTLPVWKNKANNAFKYAGLEGLMVHQDGLNIITSKGEKYIAQYEESLLREHP
jgi:hypothetical protein